MAALTSLASGSTTHPAKSKTSFLSPNSAQDEENKAMIQAYVLQEGPPQLRYDCVIEETIEMPLFHSRRDEPVEPVIEEPVAKKHGLFHSRRDPSPARTASTTPSSGTGHDLRNHGSNRGSFFRRSHDDATTAVNDDPSPKRSPSLLHKGLHRMGVGRDDERDLDPSILRAREHVMSAEAAEEEADRALDAARRRVGEAREHVRRLEEETAEDARRARIKQHHAAEVSKRGKVLGRHGL
ncbi:hypothetical protein ISF_02311 [Cordyceps fumosorosea ARSEF 2679]|uniref:Uncharacterized protein n=1 Tax=Cordyceps fumosorosea (strain ARSEF 2679) TaxID=1081104 RepID=A0A168BNC9_CORFA|nr:hypothetical protein ISF_02311 [Cordyceps fumosorosea ARSEF 2679]OAA70337.1 hypothetical protein ISF_02311 [Cordyceps fumosorosea ARSEF 2679]